VLIFIVKRFFVVLRQDFFSMKNTFKSILHDNQSHYKQAHWFVQRAIALYALCSLFLGLVHNDAWLFLVLSNLGILSSYALILRFFSNDALLSIASISILFVYPCIFVYELHGFPLMHLFFSLSLLISILYQNFTFTAIGLWPVLLYYLVNTYWYLNGQDISNTFLRVPQSEISTFFTSLLFLALISGLFYYFVVKTFKENTHKQADLLKLYAKKEQTILANTEVAQQIAKGNLGTYIKVAKDDLLGQALVSMQLSLKEIRQKEQNEKYVSDGLAQINIVLRSYDQNQAMLDRLLAYLVGYVDAIQGAIYLVEKSEQDVSLTLKACFAYNKKKHITMELKPGEGLLGQAYIEKKAIYLKEVPPDHLQITSGLGQALPRSLAIIPLLWQNEIMGMIEFASFQELHPKSIELIEKACQAIASTMINQMRKEQTERLVHDLQAQSDTMKFQEEQMRQNVEELQATQEQMRRKQEEIEKQNSLVKKNSEILQKAILKSRNVEQQLKQETQALYFQKDLFDTALEFSSAFVYRCKAENEMHMVYMSDSCYRILGYPPSDFTENIRTYSSIIHPDDVNKVNNMLINQADNFLVQYRIIRSDKQIIWVEESGRKVFDKQQQAYFVQGLIQDIDLQKKKELQTRQKLESLEREILNRRKE